jgi:hypothetical protein
LLLGALLLLSDDVESVCWKDWISKACSSVDGATNCNVVVVVVRGSGSKAQRTKNGKKANAHQKADS